MPSNYVEDSFDIQYKVPKGLGHFANNRLLSDCTLKFPCMDKYFPTHKVIIAAISNFCYEKLVKGSGSESLMLPNPIRSSF
jgi:hypothetical protein